jgi:ABC-2 type transport system ATP-binding protein
MKSEVVISVKNLKKAFRKRERKHGLAEAFKQLFNAKFEIKRALKGISFEVKKGEVLGFIGPNGAGKSTAIKAMCGILYPDSGRIKVLKYDPWEEREEYVRNIGVVFGQKSQLWWDLPAVDSFYLMRDLYNIPEKDFKKRLDFLVDLLDVKEYLGVQVRTLSLGERMRCELIVALLHNPKIVFLDEPTIGVDVVAKAKIRNFIKELNEKEGTTFIVTTHDMNDIEQLCERIIVITNGEILYDGLLNKIKDEFYNSKFINVKFHTKISKIKLPKGCKLVKGTDYEKEIEVDLKKQKVAKVVDFLIKNYKVLDLAVSDPDIDEIIKDIYEKK